MSTATTEYEVGAKMILVRKHEAEPKTVKIVRTTKTRLVVRTSGDEDLAFKRDSWKMHDSPLRSHKPAVDGHSTREAALYDFGEEALAHLKERCESREAERKAKRDAEDKRQADIAARKAEEMDEFKQAVGGVLLARSMDTMPDGTRLAVFDLPIHPRFVDEDGRKGSWERVFVVCRDKEEHEYLNGYGKDPVAAVRVEASHSWQNGGSCSFSSCSSGKYADDKEAFLKICCDVYHSW